MNLDTIIIPELRQSVEQLRVIEFSGIKCAEHMLVSCM